MEAGTKNKRMGIVSQLIQSPRRQQQNRKENAAIDA